MAIFGYGRVSTREQTTENQRLEIENAGFKVDYWFTDEGISGKTHASQRPQFVAMLDKIRDGETLVVSRLDRLGRDAEDVLRTVRTLAERKIEVIVLQLGKLDLGSSAGKLMLTMLSAVAEMERSLLVERTQAGLVRAKAEGKTLGRPSKTTPAQREEMMTKYVAGETISALARTYGISRASVLAVVNPTREPTGFGPDGVPVALIEWDRRKLRGA
ncbi:recombinase family protein [Burkholderia pseudomallei]|uniref:recombinase family protein n=1 Tax=Burkholderia pseudomallei TaxID=28450 RepID=UPI000F1A2177|nr:recombinase family protein [Burkholderia pseudomallei]CAJ3224511.1 resolvase TnpR [Burkholderia pseudomallei]CAJ4959255.1 resolvase TnpR [Burkholderia pseudomallei]CAJ6499534.1 resolvase TnpR [Burkholderia pseudomallei]CAJ7095623.1 resolvase TnpR [Burkholderia pseudomallei]VBH69888.1 resolvase TnpR [Burkholderia pseudomallei]